MLLKGEAKYIVGGRALRQDFTLELNAPKATGKVRIGGKMNEVISKWGEFITKYSVSCIFVICLSRSVRMKFLD